MPTCFVIQPFSPKFDKRYHEDYKPALEDAGLEPYRVDQDPSTERLMDSIEEEIRKATVCLADITTDNPNVWYELGYAFAMGRSVIMVCSKERGGKYPFDIQDRTIIEYASESRSDFDKLREEISKRAKALVNKIAEQPVSEAKQVAPTQDLKPLEISVLAIAAGQNTIPGTSVNTWLLSKNAVRNGLTELDFAVAIRSLQRKGMVEFNTAFDMDGQEHDTVAVTDTAWSWIDSNASRFPLMEDDIPF